GTDPNDSGRILLHKDADPQSSAQLYVEELGHAIDQRLNGNETDAVGDEGELFRSVLTGQLDLNNPNHAEQIEAIRAQDDTALARVDGEDTPVELFFDDEFSNEDLILRPKTLDEVTGTPGSSVLSQIGNWKTADYNREFSGPAAFERIYSHSTADQDLGQWLERKNLPKERPLTAGIQNYLAWASENKDGASLRNWFTKGGAVGLLNGYQNDTLSGKDGIGMNSDVFKHAPIGDLLGLKGTRSGMAGVQAAVEHRMAYGSAESQEGATFFANGKGTAFLNNYKDEQIAAMSPRMLASIPADQMRAAKGGRGLAAAKKVAASDPQVTANRQLLSDPIGVGLEAYLGSGEDPVFAQMDNIIAEYSQELGIEAGASSSSGASSSGASTSSSGLVEIPDTYQHPSMMLLSNIAPNGVPPATDQASLDDFAEQWNLSSNFTYNPALNIHGVTEPGEWPQLGPPAFSPVISPEIGEQVQLGPAGIELQVALTAAHEMSHQQQYESFQTINGSTIEAGSPYQVALEQQTHVLEALAYQSELANISNYVEQVPAGAVSAAELEALRQQARTSRDRHFDAFEDDLQLNLFLQGDIAGLMEYILDGVPDAHLQGPFPP
ncbi:MAG: hypothetical protein AAFV29_11315, partial [Myxococcota bacterium]